MTDIVLNMDREHLSLDMTEAVAAGQAHAQAYQSGKPYHHISIDNFLTPEVTDRVRAEVMALRSHEAENSSEQEHLKASYNPDALPAYSKQVLLALNSLPFLRFLEEMTGIPGLIPDPYYKGGGIHRTENGGYLGIHADFNYHKQMNLERRLNILVYLNPDWKLEYGGEFEIWTDNLKTKVAAFPPIMNRMCCFSTSSNSYHGNPNPINHPEGLPRLSIALYYYTATWDDTRVAHSTLFRPRPGSQDKPARANHMRKLLREWIPPALLKMRNK